MADTKLKHVYETYIRTTPEKLWQAITDPTLLKQYFYGATVTSDWKAGSNYTHVGPDGQPMHEGKIIEITAPSRMVQTFRTTFREDMKADRPSRVTWLVEKKGEVCKLTLVHDDFDRETPTFKSVGPGWNPVLSGLKTLLETGTPLKIEAM